MYVINVSLDCVYFFATRSIQDKEKLRIVHREMVKRFPESDGFSVMTTVESSIGRYLTDAEIYE